MPKDKKDINPVSKANLTKEMGLFEKSAHTYFVLKKAERLASAVYLVTDMIPFDDPLWRALRSGGLRVLSLITGNSGVGSRSGGTLSQVRESVSEIIGMLNVASVAGYVSSMNKAVLEREYCLFLEFLLANEDARKSLNKEFDKAFFDIKDESVWGLEGAERAGLWHSPEYKGHLSHSTPISDNSKRAHINQDIGMDRRKFVSNGSAESAERHLTRRSSILKIIGKKGRISVKDIAQHIKDCSEKTLQRELLTLVAEGVLKKEGERRWSTYVLA